MLEAVREQLYLELERRIGNTPLVEWTSEEVTTRGNRVYVKRECDNPWGSHYDRVYLALFRHFEEAGKIKRGDKVLETTSGTAGVSFSGIGKVLGYQCHVAIPKGTDAAILKRIADEDCEIYYTPEADYIAGFPKFLRGFLLQHLGEFTFLNHSMGERCGPAYTNNEVTLEALSTIGREVERIDYFVPAIGNGSSVIGPMQGLPRGTPVIGFESFQSAVAFDQLYPGNYEKRYGIAPGTLPRHRLRGTSYQGIDFPHIRSAIQGGLLTDVALVSDAEIDKDYYKQTRRRDSAELPHWDDQALILGEELNDVGRTTRAGLVVARDIARKVNGKNILVIAYTKNEVYDR